MSFLSRLLGTAPDPRESVRPLWHRVIELARDSAYYTECGVADFDRRALRHDHRHCKRGDGADRSIGDCGPKAPCWPNLFVEDMDGQLREFGVNDVVVGKRIGKLMSVLGGRLGAYRSALNAGDLDKLSGGNPAQCHLCRRRPTKPPAPRRVAERVMKLSQRLAGFSDADMLKASAIW